MREDIDFGGPSLWEQWPKDIQHVQERPDGSSDWLHEALDIDLGNGYKECSNWNSDLTKEWSLEDLFRETMDLSPDEQVELFYKIRARCEELNDKLSLDQQLTPRKLDEKAYNLMQKFLEKKKG